MIINRVQLPGERDKDFCVVSHDVSAWRIHDVEHLGFHLYCNRDAVGNMGENGDENQEGDLDMQHILQGMWV